MVSPAKLLSNRKLRPTVARLNVLALLQHDERLAPKDIYRRLDRSGQGASLATVHRALLDLVEAGLVERHHLGNGPALFTARRGTSVVHFVCRVCGGVSTADGEAVAQLFYALSDANGFALSESTVSLRGVCTGCRADN